MVGDLIDLNHGRSVLAKVLVVVGGRTEGAAPGQSVESCRHSGPGLLLEIQGAGGGALVFEEPNDDTILIRRAV
jgi:hypothetical protein